MDKEKLIKQIMKEAAADGEPLTRAEAEEVAEMELKASSSRHYEKAQGEAKPRKPATRKPDEEKIKIMTLLSEVLKNNGYEIATSKEGELSFDSFTIKLIRHRNK